MRHGTQSSDNTITSSDSLSCLDRYLCNANLNFHSKCLQSSFSGKIYPADFELDS